MTGKTLARDLLYRLIANLEQGLLPESQCSFRKECGTIDIVFAARQLQENCTYVDLNKAFDTVCREGLWKIMAKYGCPRKFIAIVRQLHDGMMARVEDNGETSEPFPVSNGVKQGCVLAPTLSVQPGILSLADRPIQRHRYRSSIKYRSDRSAFNLRRL